MFHNEVLHKLKPEFVSNIKLICILSQNKSQTIIVTKDDNVFSCGSDSNSRHNRIHISDDLNSDLDEYNYIQYLYTNCVFNESTDKRISREEPIKMIELRNKSIIEINY